MNPPKFGLDDKVEMYIQNLDSWLGPAVVNGVGQDVWGQSVYSIQGLQDFWPEKLLRLYTTPRPKAKLVEVQQDGRRFYRMVVV